MKNVKEDIQEHTDPETDCAKSEKSILNHYNAEHKGMIGRIIIRFGAIIAGLLAIMEFLRRFMIE